MWSLTAAGLRWTGAGREVERGEEDPGKRRHRVKGQPRGHDGKVRLPWVSCSPAHPPGPNPCNLGFCPGHAGGLSGLSTCRALHLSSGLKSPGRNLLLGSGISPWESRDETAG